MDGGTPPTGTAQEGKARVRTGSTITRAKYFAKLDYGTAVQGKQVILAWFAILMAVNMQTAFLTPPFGFALFYMKGTVPPSVTMLDIYKGITPFVLVQLVALVLCVIFPDIVLVLPRRFGFID
jgi:hypothetical protein